jgi:DNA modification methylase
MHCVLCLTSLDVPIRDHLTAAHNLSFDLYEQIVGLMEGTVEVMELVPCDAVTRDPGNANTHPRVNIDAIKASIVTFKGQITPAVVVDGVIYKGNGTHIAITELFDEGRLPTAMIRAGKPLFKIVRRDFTPTQAVAYGITDNQTGRLSQWDDRVLGGYFKALAAEGVDMQPLGWKLDDIKSIIAASEKKGPTKETTPDQDRIDEIADKAAELQNKWQVERGQIWSIGPHRLMCGDSTSAADVVRLMEGQRAGLIVTDPPYAVGYIEKARDMNERGYVHSRATLSAAIEGDELSDEDCATIWRGAFELALTLALNSHAAWYVWHAHMLVLYNLFKELGLLHHQTLIWVKNNFVIGRSDYQWKHEPCFYGWMKGNRPEFYGERNQTTIWQIDRDTQSPVHPTQKPVECFSIPIRNHLKSGGIVYDPFAGSCTAMVAAEVANVQARCMEKSVLHLAVALERLSLIGLTPMLAVESVP